MSVSQKRLQELIKSEFTSHDKIEYVLMYLFGQNFTDCSEDFEDGYKTAISDVMKVLQDD